MRPPPPPPPEDYGFARVRRRGSHDRRRGDPQGDAIVGGVGVVARAPADVADKGSCLIQAQSDLHEVGGARVACEEVAGDHCGSLADTGRCDGLDVRKGRNGDFDEEIVAMHDRIRPRPQTGEASRSYCVPGLFSTRPLKRCAIPLALTAWVARRYSDNCSSSVDALSDVNGSLAASIYGTRPQRAADSAVYRRCLRQC